MVDVKKGKEVERTGAMPWIGLQCGAEAGELAKWAGYVRGAGSAAVADFLTAAADLVSGRRLSVSEIERMREMERRAAEAVERKRADVAAKAGAIIGRALGKGVDAKGVMAEIGLTGWRAGAACTGNAGVNRKRAAFAGRGTAVVGTDGETAVMAAKGKPGVDGNATAKRDRTYGESWEGWCVSELRKMGFKMAHAARGAGMTATDAWRCVSGWERHWRREGTRGRAFPGPAAGWMERLDEAVGRAAGRGMKGAHVVLNGGGKEGGSE